MNFLKRFSYCSITLTLFAFCSVGVFAQQIDEAFTISEVVYAEPYYAFIGRDGDALQIRYYAYESGIVSEAFRITPDQDNLLNKQGVIWSKANDTVTVFVLTDRTTYDLVWLRHIDGKDAVIHQYEFAGDRNEREKPPVFAFDDHAFHAMDGGQEATLISILFDDEYRSVRQVTNPFSFDGVHASSLGYVNGEILVGDGSYDSEDEFNGILRLELNDADELALNGKALLTLSNNFVFSYTFDKMLTIDSLVLIKSSETVSVWQWQTPGEPQFLTANQYEPFIIFTALLSKNGLIIQPDAIDIFDRYHFFVKDANGYSEVSQITNVYPEEALGPELFIQYDNKHIAIYDITYPTVPKLIEFTYPSPSSNVSNWALYQ